jgi:hypothetical protein
LTLDGSVQLEAPVADVMARAPAHSYRQIAQRRFGDRRPHQEDSRPHIPNGGRRAAGESAPPCGALRSRDLHWSSSLADPTASALVLVGQPPKCRGASTADRSGGHAIPWTHSKSSRLQLLKPGVFPARNQVIASGAAYARRGEWAIATRGQVSYQEPTLSSAVSRSAKRRT